MERDWQKMELVFTYSTLQNSLQQSIITIHCNVLHVTLNCSTPIAAYLALNTQCCSLRKADSHLKYSSLTFTIPCLTPRSHTRPWPLCGPYPPHLFCTLTVPRPVRPPPNGSCYLQAKPFPVPFLIPSSFYSHLPACKDGTDRVFRNVGI